MSKGSVMVRNIGFTLRQKLSNAVVKIDGFFFGLRLKWLTHKYGGADKIPSSALDGTIRFSSANEELRFQCVMNACGALIELGTILNKKDSWTTDWLVSRLLGDLMHNRTASPEIEQIIVDVVMADHQRKAILAFMLKHDDISEHQHRWYHEKINNWLNGDKSNA